MSNSLLEWMGRESGIPCTEHNRYWLGVVSASHVNRGVTEGIAQLCHGKEAPLRRMRPGDWLIYYSPRTDRDGGQTLQAFTAIGRVADNEVYSFQMSESFIPFRRKISYLSCRTVGIAGLLDRLTFTRGKRSWGYAFRFGQLEMNQEDFMTIASEMLGAKEGGQPEEQVWTADM